MLKNQKIAMLGTGNMGEALVSGLVVSKTAEPENIICTDLREDKLAAMKEKFGVKTNTSNADAVKCSQIIIYAVKPQIIADVLKETAPYLDMSKLIISIAAGVPLAAIESCLQKDLRLIRVMPNIAVSVREGATAIAAGKHIYCEKPIASDLETAMALWNEVKAAGLKNGVVQDKLWLPGLVKLKKLIDDGFFGRILSVRGEFGYWVFEGEDGKLQRPSWNYRKEDGGGLIIDMLCHWRYVIDNIFGNIKSVTNLGATHIPKRWDENNNPYDSTADDSAYTTMELENGIIVHMNSSWCVRPRRDDLLTLQVDGTEGSAYAGLRKCRMQKRTETPWVVWNPDVESPINYFDGWTEFEPGVEYGNAFKIQWELFLKHVVNDEPFRWTLLEGAKGVQLAEKAIESWKKRAWVDLPELQ